MTKKLSTYTINKNNNLNLIRFIAASLVLFSHSFVLRYGSLDMEPIRPFIGLSLGHIAVDIFFVISGFLVTGSYYSKRNICDFLWARILRVYPALIVAMLFCVFIVGFYFTEYSFLHYFSSVETYKFLIKNSVLFFGVDYHLPGVFIDLPYARAINGSLWTLPHEVRMYIVLAFTLSLVSCVTKKPHLKHFKWVVLIVCIIICLLNILNYFYIFFQESSFRLLLMFVIGVTFFAWKEKIILSFNFTLFSLLILFFSSLNKDLFFITYSVLLPFILFYFAYVPSGLVRKFNYVGDYSYGIYIYAFPIQQSIIAIEPNISFVTLIVVSFFVTLALSVISWHLIEKKFVRFRLNVNNEKREVD